MTGVWYPSDGGTRSKGGGQILVENNNAIISITTSVNMKFYLRDLLVKQDISEIQMSSTSSQGQIRKNGEPCFELKGSFYYADKNGSPWTICKTSTVFLFMGDKNGLVPGELYVGFVGIEDENPVDLDAHRCTTLTFSKTKSR